MRLIRGLAMIAVAVGLMAGAPSPGDDAKAYLGRALDILQREHVNSAQADWPALRAQAERAAATATTPSQTYGAIRETIRVLGERHTQLFAPAPPHPPSPAVAPIRALPEGRLVGEHVAVLTLPSLMRDLTNPADDGRSYRNAARDFIASTRAKPICGWILDLRGHSGGDMWPGLLGLGDLLGPGSHGAFVGPQGRDA